LELTLRRDLRFLKYFFIFLKILLKINLKKY
jgi:hypothetical protein